MQHFGDKLIELRKQKGISQEELAATLNVSRQTISSWENNRTLPSIEFVHQITQFFHLETNYFFDEVPSFVEKRTTGKMGTILLIVTVAISITHLFMAFFEKVPLFCVIVSPMFVMFFYLIMGIAFRSGMKNNDFSIIAGYKPTDSITITRNKLKSLDLLCGLGAIISEMLFFVVYIDERKMFVSMVLFGVYLSFVVVANIICKIKYSSNK